MTSVIQVEGLGKRYRRGVANRAESLYEVATRLVRSPFSALRREQQETFWALRDVSFEVREGEVIGLIGRNGAGKSTLLKILSHITKPTTGWAEIRGRVRSLLEVGTGFHGELTGRENTYLSGSILGMSKREIDRKFDEIVAFAEIDKFIDTPVKRYSSGMYVRLAFAVAAHLEPEILLVDEVLAVGDASFQKRCMGKMKDVSQQGRTIIFVSHNMMAMRSLCSSGHLLDGGQILFSGPIGLCVDRYLHSANDEFSAECSTAHLPRPTVVEDKTLRITKVRIDNGADQALVYSGQPLIVEMEVEVNGPLNEVVFGMAVHTTDGLRIFECSSFDSYGPIRKLLPGKYSIRCGIKANPLNPGVYRLAVGARCESKGLDFLPDLMDFQVELGKSLESLWLEQNTGLVREDSKWSLPAARDVSMSAEIG